MFWHSMTFQCTQSQYQICNLLLLDYDKLILFTHLNWLSHAFEVPWRYYHLHLMIEVGIGKCTGSQLPHKPALVWLCNLKIFRLKTLPTSCKIIRKVRICRMIIDLGRDILNTLWKVLVQRIWDSEIHT